MSLTQTTSKPDLVSIYDEWLDSSERMQQMVQELVSGGLTEAEAKNMAHHAIIVSAKQFKEAIWHRCIVLPNLFKHFLTSVNAYDTLRALLEAYDSHYRFQKDNLYYESKTSPIAHMKAFYQLALLFERRKIRLFNACTPCLLVPCYVQIDSKIHCQNILDGR